MTVWDRIFADVRKDLPSVVDAIVRQEVYRVLDDFTQYSNVWQQEVNLNIVKDTQTYDITSQITQGKANRLMHVWDPASQSSNWPMSGIMMRVPGIITTYRAPGSNGSWKAIIAKRTTDPVDPATNYPVIDEWILDRYSDTIGRGILARLMIEPQKPYSNPMLAQVNQRAYIAGRSLARANDGKANVYNAQAWRFPQNWATRNG